ncbi:hypothetical protein ACRALDRAFT_2137865 [Sodiomyces alcalophilus JCM 7366]|uniref:uncharacterized protein n=1 Tax=Sodiomyces alcalophilus JCM 7366 TaxID=591952 RepID=UPI0039B4882D
MSSIGPQLPPNLTKRKRTPDDQGDAGSAAKQPRNADEIDVGDQSSSDEYGPSAPGERLSAEPRSIGPSRPPPTAPKSKTNDEEINLDDSDEDDYGPPAPTPSQPSPPARRIGPSLPPQRAIGPAAPPPPDHNPSATSSPASSDSEDDYGPALPTSNPSSSTTARTMQPPPSEATAAGPQRPQRDDWMLAPPTASGGYRERDPTKLKSRRFASNKPHAHKPTGGPSEISSIWTETPEQKRKRLEDAVLGRVAPAGSDLEAATQGRRRRREDDERDRKTAEHVAAARGRSLYEEHQDARRQSDHAAAAGSRKTGEYRPRRDGVEEEEDDPSKRAFDREKDMALGGRIGAAQRRELLNKAKDFGGRFQKGSYL